MNLIEINTAITDNEFVGITTQNNKMNITFPIGYNIQKQTIYHNETNKIKNLYKDVSKLLELLEQSNDLFYQTNNIKFNYSAATYLINDYLQNNLYQENQLTTNKLNNGKINWNSTLKNTIPIYSTGNIIYTNTINENIQLQNNDITDIQKFCLNKALTILGIFYNNFQIPYSKQINPEESIYKLKQKLNQTNIDRDKKLISIMIKFLIGTSTDKIGEKEIKIGTNNFHIIWEKILKNKITSLYKEKNFLPKAYYISNNNQLYTSSLKPDIIVESNKYIYIIDAKYYKINNLPQSSDIHKQLCYASYINNKTTKKIINIFLLPNEITDNKNFSYYGYATTENFKNNNGGKIHTFYIDTKTLINYPNTIIKYIINDNNKIY